MYIFIWFYMNRFIFYFNIGLSMMSLNMFGQSNISECPWSLLLNINTSSKIHKKEKKKKKKKTASPAAGVYAVINI